MPKITSNLWFDTQAVEAAEFYCSVFPNSKIVRTNNYPEGVNPGGTEAEAGSVMTVEFELDGTSFVGINGGPQFKFDEAVSFEITCSDQDEIDYYWEKLTADGGEESMCGWLKDRFGLSWQVVPGGMGELFADAESERTKRAMQAMFQMRKFDIAALYRAADGG